MGQRRRARECALQMLYQIDQTGAAADDVFGPFWDDQPAVGEGLRGFAERLVRGAIGRRAELDRLLAESSEHWRVERMAVVDRNVLRMALFELLDDPQTPPAVAIDEAIEIAKRFGGEASGQFVNGVLDAVRRRLLPATVPPVERLDRG